MAFLMTLLSTPYKRTYCFYVNKIAFHNSNNNQLKTKYYEKSLQTKINSVAKYFIFVLQDNR